MALQVLPLEAEDFPTLILHGSTALIGDDLVGQPVAFCWPVCSREDAMARCSWHFARQRRRFLDDPSVRYMKVVSASDDNHLDIISVARWHLYESGYLYERDIQWELATSGTYNDKFDFALHDKILSTRDGMRALWISPPDSPCWVLMHMVTRRSWQRKGAAKLLVRWGIDQANKTGFPAYLEAGQQGIQLYKDMGFEQVGETMSLHAFEHGDMKMTRMKYTPRANAALVSEGCIYEMESQRP